MEVSGELFVTAVLAPGKEPWYPLNMRRGGRRSRFGLFGMVKSLFALPRFEPPLVERGEMEERSK